MPGRLAENQVMAGLSLSQFFNPCFRFVQGGQRFAPNRSVTIGGPENIKRWNHGRLRFADYFLFDLAESAVFRSASFRSECLPRRQPSALLIGIRLTEYQVRRGSSSLWLALCLSSIILSPLNGNVKMSPHETGDIHVESEGTSASERDQRMHQGRYGVCQSRRTPLSERAPD